MSEREAALARLLAGSGFAGATRRPLAGDASTRRYEEIDAGGRRAILMDAAPSAESQPCPPRATPAERRALGWNATSRLAASRVEAFAAVDGHLRAQGLSAPEIYGLDVAHGFAIIEHLGDDLFARAIPAGADEVALYEAAAETLAHLHLSEAAPAALSGYGQSWPLLDFDALALEVNANLFVEWLPQAEPSIRIEDAARWERLRDGLIVKALGFPRTFTLRDYHAENLLWLPQRAGAARVGLLDFQDAVRGWRAWDFTMLLHDARRDVSADAAHAALNAYLARTGADEAAFMRELAVLGALNCLRILGLFARLDVRDNKPRYRAFMPRMWAHLESNLRHPALADMRAFVEEIAGPFLEPHHRPRRPHTAMVLAAGLGTRMRPLTDAKPKPLVRVGGRALVDHMLDRLVDAGVTRAIVNVHAFADQMEAHLAARRSPPRILISDERAQLLETGGGARKARALMGDEPIFHVNTDSVWIGEGALEGLADAYDRERMDALLLMVPIAQTLGFDLAGDFRMDSGGRLTHRFDDSSADLAWMGVQIINPAILDVEPIEPFSFRRVWKRSQDQGRLFGHVFGGTWLHVGDPAARDAAEARLQDAARIAAAGA
jgi:aminoglycoside/choline kinase family phosphotransferase/GTP:adenosylcobinamide-phosphate guanylyltransferase